MEWEVLVTDEFETWWESLSVGEQESVAKVVNVLKVQGPKLGFPYSSGIKGSTLSHLRELRIQHGGKPYRVLYAFMRLTPRGKPFSLWAPKRPGMIAGTKCKYRLPRESTGNTSLTWRRIYETEEFPGIGS